MWEKLKWCKAIICHPSEKERELWNDKERERKYTESKGTDKEIINVHRERESYKKI